MRKSLQMLMGDLREKAQICYSSTDAKAIVKTLATDGTLGMVLYRLMQGSRHMGSSSLEMVFNKLNSTFGGCVIGRGAEFGPGFVLFHSNGVVINGKVRAGENVPPAPPGDDRRRPDTDALPRWGATFTSAPAPRSSARSPWATAPASAPTRWSSTTIAPDTTVVGIPRGPSQARGRGGQTTTNGSTRAG